jgi:hypothetical protein
MDDPSLVIWERGKYLNKSSSSSAKKEENAFIFED